MKARTYAILATAVILILQAGSADAAQSDKMPAQVTKLEAQDVVAYRSLLVRQEHKSRSGVKETLEIERTVFLSMTVSAELEWVADGQYVHIPISLSDDSGKDIPNIGHIDEGDYWPHPEKLFARRPKDAKEAPEPARRNAVFPVPEKSKTFRLQVGEQSVEVKMPGKIAGMRTPTEDIKVELLSAKMTRPASRKLAIGGFEMSTAIRDHNGKPCDMLEVGFRLMPRQGNRQSSYFRWSTSWIGLTTDEGRYIQPFGWKVGGKIDCSAGSINMRPKDGKDDKWYGSEQTFYFVVPVETKAFELTYMALPVAKGRIGK